MKFIYAAFFFAAFQQPSFAHQVSNGTGKKHG
jgi:hypothetical protein